MWLGALSFFQNHTLAAPKLQSDQLNINSCKYIMTPPDSQISDTFLYLTPHKPITFKKTDVFSSCFCFFIFLHVTFKPATPSTNTPNYKATKKFNTLSCSHLPSLSDQWLQKERAYCEHIQHTAE